MKRPTDYLAETRLLGQWVGHKVPILKETACMDVEDRELIALITCYLEVEDLSLEVKKHFQKKILPYLRYMAWAKWPRDVLTDMALRKGDTTHREDLPSKTSMTEDLKDVPSDNPES